MLKGKLLNAKAKQILGREKNKKEYKKTDKALKSKARKDKSRYVEDLAAEACAMMGNHSVVYQVTKILCGNVKT